MFHTRQELIRWLTNNPPDQVIENALEFGTVENLGLFDPIPTSMHAGLIVRVVTRQGTTHLLVVSLPNRLPPRPYLWRLRTVPWRSWRGKCSSGNVSNGDNPEQYAELRKEARKDEA